MDGHEIELKAFLISRLTAITGFPLLASVRFLIHLTTSYDASTVDLPARKPYCRLVSCAFLFSSIKMDNLFTIIVSNIFPTSSRRQIGRAFQVTPCCACLTSPLGIRTRKSFFYCSGNVLVPRQRLYTRANLSAMVGVILLQIAAIRPSGPGAELPLLFLLIMALITSVEETS